MAKEAKSLIFKNAVMDVENGLIVEFTKDETFEYDLMKVLKDWSGIDGISISFKKESQLPIANNSGYEDYGE